MLVCIAVNTLIKGLGVGVCVCVCVRFLVLHVPIIIG